ncbi:MAG: competence/damage-inducible protein A [Clostridia bacterium]
MICEILSVGTELLMGQIANTDAQYLSSRLSEFGINVYRHTVVGDNPARVKAALGEALARADLVITSGGLGPTEDDLTKEMVGAYFGREMVLDQPSLDALNARMNRLHPDVPLTQNNLKQAYFPEGARVLQNLCGTAPGCVVTQGDKQVAVLPGPPSELKDMFERQLAPYLEKLTGRVIHSRFLRIVGVGESRVETMLLDLFHLGTPTLALYCAAGEVQARISVALCEGADPLPILDPVEKEIRARLGQSVYAVGRDETMASTVVKLMRANGRTLALAESCTGGMLASQVVDCPGASDVLTEAHVTYACAAKVRVLGVAQGTLEREGAVSDKCAREMAAGARRISGADYALSVTGVAGPDGGSAQTPVGTVFIGIAGPDGVRAEKFAFLGNRTWIRTLACLRALNMLREALIADAQP